MGRGHTQDICRYSIYGFLSVYLCFFLARSIEKERRNLRAVVNPGKVQVRPWGVSHQGKLISYTLILWTVFDFLTPKNSQKLNASLFHGIKCVFFFSVLQAWNVCHCQWQSEELIADFQKGFVHLFRLQIRAASTTFITQSHSIYSIFTYIWLIFMVNVGTSKYTIHGWYAQWHPNATLASFLRCCFYSKQRDEDYAPFDTDDTRLWLALKDGVSVRFPIEYPIVPVLT